MDTTNPPSSNKSAWIIGGIIILVVIAGFFIYQRSQTISQPQEEVVDLQNVLTVRAQDPDAVAVLIEYASVNVPAFIVIHADNNGVPGEIIAHSALLQPGAYSNLSVIMPITPGAHYHAMFHADDGNGLFDHLSDHTHLTDANGKEIIVPFGTRDSSTPEDRKG